MSEWEDKLLAKWANEQRQLDKHAGKTEVLVAEQPQDASNVYCSDACDKLVLEPVEATKTSICPLCRSYIEHGEAIVSADGTTWVHVVCAEQRGWHVA